MIPTNSPIKSNGNSKLTAELFEAGGVAVGEAKSAISAEPTAGQIEFGVNTRSKSLFDRHCRPPSPEYADFCNVLDRGLTQTAP